MNKFVPAVGVIAVIALGTWIWYSNNHKAGNNAAMTPAPSTTVQEQNDGAMSDQQMAPDTTPVTGQSDTQASAGVVAKTDATLAKEFNISGANFSFTPNEIKVKKGDTVKINFTNQGGTHDLVIDEFNVRTKLVQSGESDTVEFVADKAGTFEFYCSVANHRAMGMVGKLIVE